MAARRGLSVDAGLTVDAVVSAAAPRITTMTNSDGTYSDVSRKLMASMGWTKGKGLGKHEQGIDEHVKAKKREDNIGLGADASVEAQFAAGMHKGSGKASFDAGGGQWWVDSFAGALDSVRAQRGAPAEPKAKKRKAKRDAAGKKMTFLDECFAATGGASLGMRARRSQGGKLRRTEEESEAAAAAAEAESEAAVPAPEKKKKKKRKAAKDEEPAPEAQDETPEERKLRKRRRKEAKRAAAAGQ